MTLLSSLTFWSLRVDDGESVSGSRPAPVDAIRQPAE